MFDKDQLQKSYPQGYSYTIKRSLICQECFWFCYGEVKVIHIDIIS